MTFALREVRAKSIICKSGLPGADFVINPYVGCMHGCKYCYARFMKRFTGHAEPWGCFVDVKTNAPDLVPQDAASLRGKNIVVGSVTDPYQPLEARFRVTARVLEKLIPLQPKLCVLTKSDLVVRDAKLFSAFDDCTVAISISTLDPALARELEPLAPPPLQRIRALKSLKKAGVHTALFISPIIPGVTDWRAIARAASGIADEFWFENLNLYPAIAGVMRAFVKRQAPAVAVVFDAAYAKGSRYWPGEERAARAFCRERGLAAKLYFHHSRKE